MKFATELLYGTTPEKVTGSTTQPIYQTLVYYQETTKEYGKELHRMKARLGLYPRK